MMIYTLGLGNGLGVDHFDNGFQFQAMYYKFQVWQTMEVKRLGQERIVELSFKVLQRFQENQTQLQDLLRVMKMAAIQFRLQNYSQALSYHLSALKLTNSKKNIALIKVFLILDYLALQQLEEALKLFVEYENRQQNKDPNMFFLQVYCKLGLDRRYHIAYMFIRQRKSVNKLNQLISCVWLIKIYEDNGNLQKIDIAFRKSCLYLIEFSSLDSRNFYEIFQAAYFLLKFSFRKGRQRYRKLIMAKIIKILDFIDQNIDSLVSKSLMGQLEAGKDYDFCMLYIDS